VALAALDDVFHPDNPPTSAVQFDRVGYVRGYALLQLEVRQKVLHSSMEHSTRLNLHGGNLIDRLGREFE